MRGCLAHLGTFFSDYLRAVRVLPALLHHVLLYQGVLTRSG